MQSKLPHVGTTIFTVMSALAAEHKAINLSQGFPDFPVSDTLKELVKAALDADQVQYAPMAGRVDLRQQIAALVSARHGIAVDSDLEITITAGATQAIFTAIATLINPGDEVILFDPAYDCYDPAVILFGGKPVHLALRFPSYQIDWEQLEQQITAKTRLIVVNNPNNPAGSVWSEHDLKEFERILAKHKNLYVISDEVYERIQFSGQHQSVLKSELLRSRSFVMYSFGKTLHVTGWKIGYCIAPAALTAEFRKVHQFNVFCVNNTMQHAIAAYLERFNDLDTIAGMYQAKRDLFTGALKTSRFKIMPCEGTYFCLLDYSQITGESDVDFARRLTIEHGVASIPVSVFYQQRTDHKVLRFCFAKTDETLITATEKLCKI
ncbi:MAG: aminotransferase class I/II-fold pyridoxal phosphate-dependent enzyme [Bacteroidetes bacterium]|nr:aminotransferase class I/II-fold pyridoxal phosphate-dependent enzyme [Bacteroidota bacterium]